MSWADLLIVAVCLGSAGFGFWRGFAKEAMSVATWLAAIWLAWRFTWVVEPLLGEWVVAPELKVWAARAVIFIIVMMIGGILAWLARELIRATGLSGTDRVLGSLFGLGRGALIVGLAVIVLELAGLDSDPWWQQAQLKPAGDRVAAGIRYYAALGSAYLQ
ncbi:MAG TPA: CvpA family protein [Gammaproteobacteria bacterium]